LPPGWCLGSPLTCSHDRRLRVDEGADIGERLGTGALLSWLSRTSYGPLTIDDAVTPDALAELPDLIRGYEQIKLDNIRRYREAARELTARLGV